MHTGGGDRRHSYSRISLEDYDRVLYYNGQSGFDLCDYSFTDLYIWNHKYHYVVKEYRGCLLFRGGTRARPLWLFPLGCGDLCAAIGLMGEEAHGHDAPLRFTALSEEMARSLDDMFPGRFAYTENRDGADYIYRVSDLTELRGKRYHGKRNFVNRFREEFAGRWSYEPITEHNLDRVWAFHYAWRRKNGGDSDRTLREEGATIAIALDNYARLRLHGGLLCVGGECVAFSFGSPITGSTYGIQIEKADYDVPGAYQMINREFLLQFCAGYEFVNREDDMGVEGLRRAKLSYHPCRIAMKYEAVEG